MIVLEGSLMLVALPCAMACPLFIILSFWSRDLRYALWGLGAGVVANTLTCLVVLLEGHPAAASISGVLAVICALGWWEAWKRRRRDRAPRSYGYKARAALAALVRRARESARPRPVLRPQPGGVR